MKTKTEIAGLADWWGLSPRAAERWLDRGAPLDRWIAMPDWSATLPDKTSCKLTDAFQANIWAAAQMRDAPRAGTAQAGMWLAAYDHEEALGQPLPRLPKTLADWGNGTTHKITDVKRGISARDCVAFVDWFDFWGNRPYIEHEFVYPGRKWAEAWSLAKQRACPYLAMHLKKPARRGKALR